MLRIPKAHFAERRRRVEKLLVSEGLDGLVVFAHGSALGWGTQTHPYLRWLCDWDGMITPSVLVMKGNEGPVLLTPQMFLYQARQETACIEDIRYTRREEFGSVVADVLDASRKNCAARYGFVGRDECPLLLWESLRRELPSVQWSDFTAPLSSLIVEKGEVELELCRRAAGICDLMLASLATEIRSGKQVFQIMAELERVGRQEGCEHCLTWLTVAPNADYARLQKLACLNVPKDGDQVILGIY